MERELVWGGKRGGKGVEDDSVTTQPLLGLRGRATTRLRRATTVGRVVFPIDDVSRRRPTRNFT